MRGGEVAAVSAVVAVERHLQAVAASLFVVEDKADGVERLGLAAHWDLKDKG